MQSQTPVRAVPHGPACLQGHTTFPRVSSAGEKGCVHGTSQTRYGAQAWQLLVQAWLGLRLGLLNRLKAESTEEGGPEGAQVEMPVVLMHFADVGDHLPIGIVQASPEGPTVAEF